MYFLILDFLPNEPSAPRVLMEEGEIRFFEDLVEVEDYITNNDIANYFIGLFDEEFMDIESLKYIQDVSAR